MVSFYLLIIGCVGMDTNTKYLHSAEYFNYFVYLHSAPLHLCR